MRCGRGRFARTDAQGPKIPFVFAEAGRTVRAGMIEAGPTPFREIEVFWGELAPSEHLLQMYEDDGVFLDSLEGFVAGGLRIGDAAVVIATAEHLRALEQRLRAAGIDVEAASETDQYIALDAAETLARFMKEGWPDEQRFHEVVSELLGRARRGGRRVRAFGEMVAIMWQSGHQGGTVRLEHLWHELCNKEAFSLFCAYPKSGFTDDARISVQQICDTHSRILAGRGMQAAAAA